MNYTPEPWRINGDIGPCVIGNTTRMIGECFEDGEAPNAEDEANASRIVACVNLLAGFTTEDIEAGRVLVSHEEAT